MRIQRALISGFLPFAVFGGGLFLRAEPPKSRAPKHFAWKAATAEPEPGKYFVDSIRFPHINVELACVSNGSVATCSDPPAYPLMVGKPFAVKARASPIVPLTIQVESGAASKTSGTGSLVSTPTQKGKLELLVKTSTDDPGVVFALDVAAPEDLPQAAVCPALTPGITARQPSATSIVSLLGSPKPFRLEAHGPDTIAIYSSNPSPKANSALLQTIKKRAYDLRHIPAEQLGLPVSSAQAKFSIEFEVPHADALGNLASKVASLHNSQFTPENVGVNRIRITSGSIPSCHEWRSFLADFRQLVWNLDPQPSSTKLFYQSAADVSATLKALVSGAADPAKGDDAASPSADSDAGHDSPGDATAAMSTAKAASKKKTISAAALSGSGPAPAAQPPVVNGLGPDYLVFGDAHPGDDAAIEEQRRVLALLDLPRPEMIISAWVLQNSSTDGKSVGNFNDIVNRMVSANNEALQNGILNAWDYLRDRINNEGDSFFNPLFYQYIVGRHIALVEPSSPDGGPPNVAIEGFLKKQSTVARAGNKSAFESFAACPSDQYCLGYVDLFRPPAPRLTDLLLTVIAAANPQGTVQEAARKMEVLNAPEGVDRQPVQNNTDFEAAIKKRLGLQDAYPFRLKTCESRDIDGLTKKPAPGTQPGIQLHCFREAAALLLKDAQGHAEPSPIGLMRAAVADFLYNYKLSQQYPHEFSPYDLGRSADVLNSALLPVINAFNRDVRTFQRFLGAEIELEVDDFNRRNKTKLWFQDKPTFLNNGIVTVRTISGKESTVDTTSQSFLDASTAPQIADLAKSILNPAASSDSGANGGGGSGAGAGAASDIIGHLTPLQAQLITGTLAAYQSSKIQIGRGLTLDVKPRSLNGAVSAEISVKLNASETAPPNYWDGSGQSKAADLSRIATHNTTTDIRVDSIKLFDVSAFTAVLQRSRSRFPLLPPFVEIPYIGTAVGVPLPRATEYHSSTALLSAIVVPTAADLASVAVFRPDLIVDAGDSDACSWPEPAPDKQHPVPACGLRRAISLTDFSGEPIRNFHRAMITCLATGKFSSVLASRSSGVPCAQEPPTFDKVLHTRP